jgi:prepilin-type N-terminal cleavage/methylation domain-containing protein
MNVLFKSMNLKKEKKNRGFTLLEMLISISLFTVVTTIAFSALFSIMDANDKAKTIKLVVNNLSTAMESMTREIRVGTDYTCNGSATPISGGYDCPSGEDQISFISESGEDVSY